MKYELTVKGVMYAKPIKSSNVCPPLVTPLHKSTVLGNHVPAMSSAFGPTTKVAPRELLTTGVASTSTMLHNFG